MSGLLRDRYRADGFVFLPGALDDGALATCLEAFEWSVANPGPAASTLFPGHDGRFYQDLSNPAAPTSAPYHKVLTETPVGARVAELWGESDLWFMYEQVFLKEGGATRRTPWHQDAPYLSVDGDHLAVMWITFDPLDREESLELVRCSHRGTLYNTSRFDPDDETAPLWEGLPRLPDIEANRAGWDIVGWEFEPGDILVFHPRMLHGGAPTRPGRRRRTLSLRFFGPDAAYVTRPGGGVAPMVAGLHESLTDGAPFRHPAFPKVPIPRAVDA